MDSGEIVAVDAIADPMVKESVTLLLELLRLRCEVTEDGKTFQKTSNTIPLEETFDDMLKQPTVDSQAKPEVYLFEFQLFANASAIPISHGSLLMLALLTSPLLDS